MQSLRNSRTCFSLIGIPLRICVENSFIVADEDGETAAASAEVYRPNMATEEPGLLSVAAATNSLNIVLYGKNLMHFVKYVSASAPGSRWDVACEYAIDDAGDSELDLGADAAAPEDGQGDDEDDDDGDHDDGDDEAAVAAAVAQEQPDSKRAKHAE